MSAMQTQQPLHKAVAHIDLDAFYAQVEMKQQPSLRGKPVGVVQYNPYGNLETRGADEDRIMNKSNGSLIAVSYEARASGVKRNMRGPDARAVCPEIQLVQVPTAHGKADLTLYRSEGKKVLDVLARLARTERASIDECYLDLTEEAHRRLAAGGGVADLPPSPEQVHVMQESGFVAATDWWHRPQEQWQAGERLLACAAAAVADLRAAVKAELGYTCSAGIAHTKLLAKLCSGLHKPAQQTVLPAVAVPALLGPLALPKLKGLGGKFGEQIMSELGIETVGQLAATPLSRLEQGFGDKDAQWLFALARGVTDDSVEERKLPKSVNCGKTFRGRQALKDLDTLHTWLLELGGELSERLEADREANNRVPQLLTVSFSTELPWAAAQQGGFQANAAYQGISRSCPLRQLSAEAIAEDATALVRRWAAEQGSGWSIGNLAITAGNFVPVQSAASAITRFFKPAPAVAAAVAGVAAAEAAAAAGQRTGIGQDPELGQQQHTASPGQGQAQQHQTQQQQQAASPEQGLAQQHALPGREQPSADAGQLQQQQPEHADGGGSSGRSACKQQLVQPPGPPVSAAGASSSADAPQNLAAGPSGCTGSDAAGTQPQHHHQQSDDMVDESVLAELPPELQREIRDQMQFQRMAAHLDQRRQPAGGPAGKSKQPASRNSSGGRRGGSKRPGSGSGTAAASGTMRIDAFLKGKRPKHDP